MMEKITPLSLEVLCLLGSLSLEVLCLLGFVCGGGRLRIYTLVSS